MLSDGAISGSVGGTRRGFAVQNVPPTTEDHVSEHLPWEHLTIPPAPDRRFLIYGVAAGLVIAVLGVVVVRQFQVPSPEELTPVTPVADSREAAPVEEVIPTTQEEVPGPVVTLAPAEPEAPSEVSEADLRVVEPGNPHQEVTAQAEWLVLEFFTLDPTDPWRDRVETASGLRLPSDLAPDTPDGTAVSYVEWTRARSVEQIGRSTFRATVLLRRLVAPDGNDLRRLPTEQVTVTLQIEADGRIRADSLPEVTSPPIVELVPMAGEHPRWVFDQAGIGWPSSRADGSATTPYDPLQEG